MIGAPVTRVVGAPAAPTTATPPAAAPAAGGLLQNKTALMIGGAVLVAGFAAFSAFRNPTSAADPAPADPATVDTTVTDLYNNLQPELEQIGSKLDQINNPPRPAVPTPVTPTPPKPTVPPPTQKPGYTYHTVLKGENIANIATRYGTTQGRVFASNVKGKKRADGSVGTLLQYADVKPGVRLVIPEAIKGNAK